MTEKQEELDEKDFKRKQQKKEKRDRRKQNFLDACSAAIKDLKMKIKISLIVIGAIVLLGAMAFLII